MCYINELNKSSKEDYKKRAHLDLTFQENLVVFYDTTGGSWLLVMMH